MIDWGDRIEFIEFGDLNTDQFYDKTPLRLYKNRNNKNPDKRRHYRKNFRYVKKWTRVWFEITYLY